MSEKRCHGAGEVIEVLTPGVDPRDPAHATREWICPGCLDCLAGEVLEREEFELLDEGPSCTFAITDEGVVAIGELPLGQGLPFDGR